MEYKSKNVICQNCKGKFIIEPEDFNFYEKIKVPPPTFCHECRTVRRLCWRNEMSLFKRKNDVPGTNEIIISFIHPEEKVFVYDNKYWWSDKWDPQDYAQDYNFSKNFFIQWKELRDKVPIQSLSNSNAVNSDYCNVAEESKDSYMSSGSWKIEKTLYSNRIVGIKECSDLFIADKLELCYEDVICTNSYHLLYSINSHNCVDSYFLYDCHGCTNCFGSTNLRHKSYYMWNQQLTKEEYEEKLSQIDLKDYNTIIELKKKFKNLYKKAIHKFSNQNKVFNCTGDNLGLAKNCFMCFDVKNNVENLKYVHWAVEMVKDVYDSGPGIGSLELGYEVFDTGAGGGNILFGSVVYYGQNIEYSFNCYGCSNLFGCIGLRNKKYCILNKQYSKKEYEEMLPKIKQQMIDLPYVDKRGIVYKYGEFFPSELSTFCYNETQAQDYFPLTKKEAIKKGYRWRDRKNTEYEITIDSKDLPNEFDNSILKEIIGCENKDKDNTYCRGAFKIIQEELNLYKKLGVPLPRKCFYCRHEERLKIRNPMKLWHRKCMYKGRSDSLGTEDSGRTSESPQTRMSCNNEFETPYAPDRPEIIYCEECYKREIY